MACVQIDECVAGESRTVRARRAGFVAALAFSALMGLALMFVLVTPQRVGMVRTPELAGMLGLLLLPLATAWVVGRTRRGTSGLESRTRSARAVVHERSVRDSESPRAAPAGTGGAAGATPPTDWQVVIPVEMYQRRGSPARATAPTRRAELAAVRELKPRGRATASRKVANPHGRVSDDPRRVSRPTQAA